MQMGHIVHEKLRRTSFHSLLCLYHLSRSFQLLYHRFDTKLCSSLLVHPPPSEKYFSCSHFPPMHRQHLWTLMHRYLIREVLPFLWDTFYKKLIDCLVVPLFLFYSFILGCSSMDRGIITSPRDIIITSLVTNNVKYLFMWIFAIHTFLVKCEIIF
jgi:hypothetical protein